MIDEISRERKQIESNAPCSMTDIEMLYVMRHGETEDNIRKTITAQADSPLTTLGHKQAVDKDILLRELVGDLVAGVRFEPFA